MSVVLNALRSQKEDLKLSESLTQSGEGLFLGKKGFLKEKNKIFPKRVLVLSGIMVLAIAFSAALWFWKEPLIGKQVVEAPAPDVIASAAKQSHGNKEIATSPAAPRNDKEAHNPARMAHDAFQQGRLDESMQHYQRALKENPSSASLHNDIGLVFLKKELYSSSEKHFSRALELDSQCAECFNNLGYLKTVLNETVEAEKYFKKAIAIKSDYPNPHFNLAVLYEKNGDIGSAVHSYQAFLQRFPGTDSQVFSQVKQHLYELTGR